MDTQFVHRKEGFNKKLIPQVCNIVIKPGFALRKSYYCINCELSWYFDKSHYGKNEGNKHNGYKTARTIDYF